VPVETISASRTFCSDPQHQPAAAVPSRSWQPEESRAQHGFSCFLDERRNHSAEIIDLPHNEAKLFLSPVHANPRTAIAAELETLGSPCMLRLKG
jgi:hypothetical protein